MHQSRQSPPPRARSLPKVALHSLPGCRPNSMSKNARRPKPKLMRSVASPPSPSPPRQRRSRRQSCRSSPRHSRSLHSRPNSPHRRRPRPLQPSTARSNVTRPNTTRASTKSSRHAHKVSHPATAPPPYPASPPNEPTPSHPNCRRCLAPTAVVSALQSPSHRLSRRRNPLVSRRPSALHRCPPKSKRHCSPRCWLGMIDPRAMTVHRCSTNERGETNPSCSLRMRWNRWAPRHGESIPVRRNPSRTWKMSGFFQPRSWASPSRSTERWSNSPTAPTPSLASRRKSRQRSTLSHPTSERTSTNSLVSSGSSLKVRLSRSTRVGRAVKLSQTLRSLTGRRFSNYRPATTSRMAVD